MFLIYRMFEEFYYTIDLSTIHEIIMFTNCIKPCHYKKYQIVGDKSPTSFKSNFSTISFWAVSMDTVVEKETLMYPLTSLVAEFGGTLGLFLGFSFMVVWDWAVKCVLRCASLMS